MFRSTTVFTTVDYWSTKLTFLGFIIDTVDMKLYLPQDKLDKTVSACSNQISNAMPTIRQVAQVTGLLVSAFLAVPFIYDFITRPLSRVGPVVYLSSTMTVISSDAMADLKSVVQNLSQYNGCFLVRNRSALLSNLMLVYLDGFHMWWSSCPRTVSP